MNEQEIAKTEAFIEIKLDEGRNVKIRKSISARVYLHLKNLVIKQAELETKQDGYSKNGSPKVTVTPKISGETLASVEEETMKAYIIEFNGDVNNAYSRFLDEGNASDYEKVKSAVDQAYAAETKK